MPNQIVQPMPPPPWIIANDFATAAGASGTLTANNVYLYTFTTPVPITITKLLWRMAATVTGTTDLGVYDGNGNLLVHTGVQTNVASSVTSVTLGTPLYLPAGKYSLALCPSNGTDTYYRAGGMSLSSLSTSDTYIATNAGTAGVLPNTTGTLLSSNNAPVIAAKISGGAP